MVGSSENRHEYTRARTAALRCSVWGGGGNCGPPPDKVLTVTTCRSKRSPWLYVPSLYFFEGLPFIIVNTVSTILYKKLGMSNQFIGLTSALYLPWVVKMFWSPVVDVYYTKRSWILGCQLCLCLALAMLAQSLLAAHVPVLTLICFGMIAFVSATQDIAIDGYYMLVLDGRRQAFFLGIRSIFYRLAVIFGSGLLVILAGTLEKRSGDIPLSWSAAMTLPAALFATAFLVHRHYLPRPEPDSRAAEAGGRLGFTQAFRTYFQQDKAIVVVLFILLFRLGEAMLTKMATPFLLDGPQSGGLGLATDTVGFVYGTVGVVSLSAGGILGGVLIARYGLRKCIWPMAIMLNAPDLLYVYMAVARPTLTKVYALVAAEQFGYGLGFTAFAVFLMYNARQPYKTSHFAISTGLMALGMMLPGMFSGLLQSALGYPLFFGAVTALTLPGMFLLLALPLDFAEK